jgi:hypothetical protein
MLLALFETDRQGSGEGLVSLPGTGASRKTTGRARGGADAVGRCITGYEQGDGDMCSRVFRPQSTPSATVCPARWALGTAWV